MRFAWYKFSTACVMSVMLMACTVQPHVEQTHSEMQQQAVSLGGGPQAESNEHRVAVRAQLRWNAVLKEDFAEAYRFLSPGRREVESLERYRRSLPLGFWLDAKVGKVTCSEQNKCMAEVYIKYRHGYLGRELPGERWVEEVWLKSAENWWFVPAN